MDSRRAFLAAAAGALGALAGCSKSTPGECAPATFPTGTATRTAAPSACQYGAELEHRGVDVDSTVTDGGGGAGVFYFHRPDRHAEDINTVARAFVQYRRIVAEDMVFTFTALENSEDRHGNGYIAREWADARAAGEMTKSEYLSTVRDTYATR